MQGFVSLLCIIKKQAIKLSIVESISNCMKLSSQEGCVEITATNQPLYLNKYVYICVI